MDVQQLVQQIVSGIMTGSIYGVLALALVMIFQSTQMFNFGQGEMATFTTFLGFSLMTKVGLPYSIGFALTVLIAFAIGAALERGLIRMVEGKAPMNAVIIGLGLFLAFNSLGGSFYGADPKAFPQPFAGSPIEIAGITISKHNLYLFCVAIALTGAVYALFQHTKIGLAMRVTAFNRPAAELMGVPTGLMLMLGWGLAAALGAAAGMLVAPIVVLAPGMMFTILLFGFAAAVLGGLDSAPGAIVGGVIVGVTQNLVGVYLGDWVSALHLGSLGIHIDQPNQYRDIVAMALIIVVLAIRPRGIFGRPQVQRV